MLTRQELAAALTALREAAGLSVRDLARAADVRLGTLSGWCTGRHLPTLSQRAEFLRVLVACGVADADEEQWLACWLRRPLGRRRTEDATPPYRGLEVFQPDHAKWFFGRSRLTDVLLQRVTDPASLHRLVMLVGPSGSGKSSVLRAGVLATLADCHWGGEQWQSILLSPGEHGIWALAAELAPFADLPEDTLAAELLVDPPQAAARFCQRLTQPLVIVVDQFEEVFTLCSDAAVQGAFLAALEALSESPMGRAGVEVRVVAGMRADFYPDALQWPILVRALQDSQVTIGPMNEEELRQAIVEPARFAGVQFDDGLAQLLLRELAPDDVTRGAHDLGALPLLSHALLATWEHRQARAMTVADYTATGGIRSAVAQTAEAVYADLTTEQQRLAKRLLVRLIHVGEDTPDTRRRVPLDELTGQSHEANYGEARQILGRFVDARLLIADADGVEISHEALLQAWPRLRDWIDADRAGHRLRRQLTDAALMWKESACDPGTLYRGARLEAMVDWLTKQEHREELNDLERQFVDTSIDADRAAQRRKRTRTRRLRWLAAALATMLVLSGITAAYSFRLRGVADEERDLAVSRQIAGTVERLRDSDPGLAAQLAVAAYRIAPTVEARSALLATSASIAVTRMVRPSGALQAVAVNPAGTLLAAAGATESDTSVLLWDLSKPDRPVLLPTQLTGHTGPIYAVAFSSDGTMLATGSTDTTVRLWDIADPARPRLLSQPMTGPRGAVLAVEFSPDNNTLVAGGRDKAIRFWDIEDREHPTRIGAELTGSTGAVQSITFTPDGTVFAAADAGGAVHIWHRTEPDRWESLGPPLGIPSMVNSVSFSPDGLTLAAGSKDGVVRLWNMVDPARPTSAGELPGATGWINAIAFSASGKRLAAANADGRVHVWDMERHKLLLDLPHKEPTTAVAFRDDDQVLYTNSADGTARRWRIPGPILPTSERATTTLAYHPNQPLLIDAGADVQIWDLTDLNHPKPVGSPLVAPPGSDRMSGTVDVSADGNILAAATRAGNEVLLWDITRPAQPRQLPVRLTAHTGLIEVVKFSHGGSLLASAAQDGTVRLWNTGDPEQPALLATLDTRIGAVFATAFSPDGSILAAATLHGYLLLWDIRNPQAPKPLGEPTVIAGDDANSLTISPDGRTAAVGIADGTVRLWDISDPQRPVALGQPITGPEGFMVALAFNPDGTTLAGGSGSGQVWLWDITDLQRPRTLAMMQYQRETTWNLEFSPDGHALAATTGDIRITQTNPERVIGQICSISGDPITRDEWSKYVPGASFQTIC